MEEVTDAERWADIAAEELARALVPHGIGFHGIGSDSDGDVNIAFKSLADAEALMTLAVESDDVVGGFYDRATSSCLTLSSFEDTPTDEQLEHAITTGWKWTIHPAMRGRRMGWHVSVDLNASDANTLTANLNALRNGGVL